MSEIPDQLRGFELLKIYGPSADCDHPGKQPIGSATDGPFYQADDPHLVRHIENGGNVGFPLSGPIVVFDVDHDRFGELLDERLPPTFTVRTGSGGGHRYYHSPDWTDDRQFNVEGTDYGSLRSDGWQVVIPPSVHPGTGERYRIEADREITSVGSHEIVRVLDALETGSVASQHTGGGSGEPAAAGRVGGSSLPRCPDEYPNRPANWKTLRSWLSANGLLEELNLSSGDRSSREFTIAKCLAEGGFSEAAIANALDRLPHDSKWHERNDNYRNRTVRKAVIAAVEDDYVEFSSTGDMDRNRSESHKTEESGNSRTLPGGDTEMPDFTDKLSVSVLEGSEDGDSFKNVVLVEGNDDGESFEYISLKKGQIQEANTTDGKTVLVENVRDSVSLGSPDYLDDLISGLEKMKEELDD
jgi:DNA-binding CsgD family transcriptional regulator